MPTLRTALSDPSLARRRAVPRDDLFVREREVAPGHFVADAGPWSVWDRRIEDGQEVLRYRIAAPHWGRLVDQMIRRPARNGVALDQSPVWAPNGRLDRHDATVMGLCATLSLLAGFLGGLIGQTISFIARDLGGTTSTQATALAVIRVGAVITLAATALADRRGRRPLIGACLIGASLASLVTAVAPGMGTVTASQLVARGLVAGAAFLIPIVCSEELPAHSRAYSIGLMSLPGGLGVGVVLWFVPFLDVSANAWRFLFALAIVPLVLTVRTMRRLPETRRFVHDDATDVHHDHQHIRMSRLALLGAGMFLLNVFAAPTQQLQTDYLQNTRSMSAGAIAAFLVLTNTWGFVGIAFGARLADGSSRRLAATIGLVGLAVGNTVMFQVSGWPMWGASLVGSLVGAAVIPSLGALLPELFPTLRRGGANGLLNGAAVLGSIAGLLTVRHYVTDGNYGPTVAALAVGPLLVAVIVWWLPESAGMELEALNPDDEAV